MADNFDDLDHFDRAVKMQKEYQGVLAKSTQGLQDQIDLMKEMEERARQRVSVEKLYSAATTNLAKVQAEILLESGKLQQMQTKNSQATAQQLSYQRDLVSMYRDEIDAAERLMSTADDLVKAEQERLRISQELETSNRRGSIYADKLFSGVDKLLGKMPGGDILRNIFNVDVIKSKVATDSAKVFKGMTDGSISAGKGMTQLGSIGSKALYKLAANPIGPIVLAIIAAIQRFIELDKAAEEFRKTTGLIKTQMGHISTIARDVNVRMRHLGVGIAEAYKSAAELVETFQTAYAVTDSVTANIAQLAANIGVAEGDSAKLYQTFLGMGNTTSEMAQNLMHAGVALANASGVPIAAVFKDIASASNDAMIFMGHSPILMLRTAVEARRLGTTMENLTKSAKTLLNFQDSINSEMEASALTGRTLNFQAARQLAFQGEIVKSREAAMKQIKSLGDFQKMSVFQQEAVAKAAGMEVSEIIKMQAQEKQLAELKRTNYKLWKQQDDARKEAAKASEKTLAQQGEELAKQQLRQAEITKMTNQLKAIWTDITDALMPIARVIMPIIMIVVKAVASVLKIVSGLLKGIFGDAKEGAATFEQFGKIIEDYVLPAIGYIGTAFETVFGFVGAAIKALINVWLYPFIKGISLMIDLFTGGPRQFVEGLKSVIPEMWDALTTPFKKAWEWISELWSGHSPSKIGLSILKGIVSIGKGLIGALIMPFKIGFKVITGLFSGDFMKTIKSVGSTVLSNLAKPFKVVGNIAKRAWAAIPKPKIDMSGVIDKAKSAMFDISSKVMAVGKVVTDGVKKMSEFIFNTLTNVFSKAVEFIKRIPIIGKLFSAAGNIVSKITDDISQQVEAKTSAIVEIKNLDVLREAIDALTSAVAQLGSIGASTMTPVETDKTAAKVQELIDLLRNGAIAVNLDGRRVSSALTNVGR